MILSAVPDCKIEKVNEAIFTYQSRIKSMNRLSYKFNAQNQPVLSPGLKKTAVRVLLSLGWCMGSVIGICQKDNRLALADKYFASGEYYTAAGLYEQILNPVQPVKAYPVFPLNAKKNRTAGGVKQINRLDILYKQAESYRMANYWPSASAGYKTCFEKDAEKYKTGLYWYAVCQRSTGNYDDAEATINLFLERTGENDPYYNEAKDELERIQFIKTQHARPDSILYQVHKVNTSFGKEKGVFAATMIGENQFLITSTQSDPVAKPGVNPFHNRLFTSSFSNDSMQSILPVVIGGADATLNQGAGSISANGNYLYFTQWSKQGGKSISRIYVSKKTEKGWSSAVMLPFVSDSLHNSKQPFCSADGKYLFFSSDRPGGYGKFDIWYATLKADGTTGEAINAGEILNSSANEQAPFYHGSSGTLVFSSDREPGMGGYDLFSSVGSDTEWGAPENMGHPINSSRDDVYFFASQKESLLGKFILSSDRGSECCLETYAIGKAPKRQLINGIVRDCRGEEPLAGALVELKDVSGGTVQVTTGSNGVYEFELKKEIKDYQLSITKELYKNKEASIVIAGSDISDWLKDVHLNAEVCLEKKLVIKPENVVTVYFDFDRSLLRDRGIIQLDSIYNVLTVDTTATLQISGYTDGLGSVEYNKVLSDKRARACADYLIGKGVDAGRISFESFGACCPIEMEIINGRDNPDGRSMNRRALINISKTEPLQ